MPTPADAQAAVAQHKAVTQQGTDWWPDAARANYGWGGVGAGSVGDSGSAGGSGGRDYGYAPLKTTVPSVPASPASSGYGLNAWNSAFEPGLSPGIPLTYSGDPDNSPALQMLRMRAAQPDAQSPMSMSTSGAGTVTSSASPMVPLAKAVASVPVEEAWRADPMRA